MGFVLVDQSALQIRKPAAHRSAPQHGPMPVNPPGWVPPSFHAGRSGLNSILPMERTMIEKAI